MKINGVLLVVKRAQSCSIKPEVEGLLLGTKVHSFDLSSAFWKQWDEHINPTVKAMMARAMMSVGGVDGMESSCLDNSQTQKRDHPAGEDHHKELVAVGVSVASLGSVVVQPKKDEPGGSDEEDLLHGVFLGCCGQGRQGLVVIPCRRLSALI